MPNLASLLNQLQQERNRLTSQLQSLNNALLAMRGVNMTPARRRGKMSAAGRARIAAAQRARWAKVKGQKVVSIASPKRRRMSAAAIAHIRAGQKARWVKWRNAQKKKR